ncbi:uncharacterized protein LY89DRAFT_631807 [Mollisia scopiformis]|uniref:CENP-V/GFA domain-containing protein n=1 Tax=Mollisia scopiformis TaxID=149040 RepID=A0A132B485_MOLSC|nr:uncharacterized protein LY89DRAFT_631807 [Mollisia scopiformis]KUJ07228.1 hypothetical protein LY89DRAFT_631807 [Mollisia scopiformis]
MSPLPSGPFTLHGGCDCTAVRYTISVPAGTTTPSEENRLLKIFFDHCNKCRRVSGALVQAWLSCPQEWLEWSVGSTGPLPSEEKVRTWVTTSTKDVLKSVPGASPVANYASSPGVTRTFCGRCGTNLAYFYAGKGEPEATPMIDIVLGSLDTESLEMEGMRPDRHLYWESGINWVKELVTGGDKSLALGEEKLPRHPSGSRLETC